MMAGRKEQTPILRERVVIIDAETPECEILPVLDINEERILAAGMDGNRSIPFVDAVQKISPEGKVYVLYASDQYVQETKHLAMVERNTVIREAVNYQRPGTVERKTPGLLRFLPWSLVGLVLILWVTKH